MVCVETNVLVYRQSKLRVIFMSGMKQDDITYSMCSLIYNVFLFHMDVCNREWKEICELDYWVNEENG